MNHWANFSAWREHRRELLREARRARETFAHSKKRPGAVEVRWGLPEDEAKVAELPELNGMPRWVALEERFVVAERDGEVLAAARYRTEPKRLLLGLLVADPWAGERRLAVDLYAGARGLALELEASDVVARIDRRRADYPYEAGYHRWGAAGGWICHDRSSAARFFPRAAGAGGSPLWVRSSRLSLCRRGGRGNRGHDRTKHLRRGRGRCRPQWPPLRVVPKRRTTSQGVNKQPTSHHFGGEIGPYREC